MHDFKNTLTKRFCCEDFSHIEGYNEAISSEDLYDIHHRLETHDENGIKRDKFLKAKELIEMGLYFNRPASELIFMKHSEHTKLHHTGNKDLSSKISKSMIGKNVGKHVGEKWFNNGVIEVRAYECPDGFEKGRLKKRTIR